LTAGSATDDAGVVSDLEAPTRSDLDVPTSVGQEAPKGHDEPETPERNKQTADDKSTRRQQLALAVVFLMTVMGIGLYAAGGVDSLPYVAVLAVAAGMVQGLYIVSTETPEVERAREDQVELLKDIRENIRETAGVPDLAALFAFNERQMRVYQELSTGQARSSYQRSQISFTIGLLLIVGAVGAAFAGNDTTTKLAAGGVAGLGGAFSAYISATYLRVYERTLDQLNFYYRQPLVNSYLLTAERLAHDMTDDSRDEAYTELLREVLTCARAPADGAPIRPSVDIARSSARNRLKRKRRPPSA